MRLETLPCPLPGLPPELDGLRIAHLSDFHLGVPSRGRAAVERAVEWVEERQPDLTLVSGDLLSRARGEPLLRALLARLPRCFAILGNHDFALTRDPFSLQPRSPTSSRRRCCSTTHGRSSSAGAASRSPASTRARSAGGSRSPSDLVGDEADLRILLCHYPDVIDRLPEGAFDLVLSGHLHDGQICVPWPGGRLRLAHLRVELHPRPLPSAGRDAARLRRARDDVRAVPLPRAAGGDRAGS